MNILVLGAGGNVSQGIIKAIRKSDLDIHLIGACVSPMAAGLYMCDEACISPYACEESFMDWLVETCNRLGVDMILTGVEENIRAIAEQIGYLKQRTAAIFISSSCEQLRTGQDKLLTAQWLKENGCNYPRYCKLDDKAQVAELVKKTGFPLLAKPRRGKGSRGLYVIRSQEELEKMEGLKNYVLEEYIGSSEREYTVGCYCDRNGVLMDVIVMHRMLRNGTTVWAKVIENGRIRREAEKICRAFRPRGPFNIQMRLNSEGIPICFELNVRFSGTTAMRANFGYCDVEAMIREYVLEEPIEKCFHVVPGEAYRYDEEMYLFGGATDQMKAHREISDMSQFHIFQRMRSDKEM